MAIANRPARDLTGKRVVRAPGISRSRFRMMLGAAILTSMGAAATVWSEAPVAFAGTLLDVDGNAIPQASVTLSSGSRVDARAVSSPTGRWQITGGHRIDSQQIVIAAPGFLPVSVSMSSEGPPVRTVLHRLPRLMGAVSNEAGTPIAGAEVLLVQPGKPGEWLAESAADGGFAMEGTLLPGPYRVTVTAPNHDPFESTQMLLADGSLRLTPTLVQQVGTFEITTTPAGVQPAVDGLPLAGCRTPCVATLVVGDHTIRIETELYVPFEQKISLANRQKVNLAPVLERKRGTLTVAAPEGDGELTIDGEAVAGRAFSGLVSTGGHSVGYRAGGYWPATATVTVGWNQTATVDLGTSLTPIKPGDEAGFLAGMERYLRSAGGQFGVYIQELGSGREMGYHQDDVMEAASDIKIPVALYLLHQVEAKAIKLEDKIAIQDSDFMGGTGTLNGTAHNGDTYSYRDLLGLLIQQSDNTAWQALVRTFGADKVDAYSASLGAPACHQDDDNCTAHQAGLLLAGLYRGKTLNPPNTDLLLLLLKNTAYNDRINYYLPGIAVAHKTGADGGVMNDVGIVYLSSGPVLISMFTFTDSGTVQPIRDVARAVVRYFTGR